MREQDGVRSNKLLVSFEKAGRSNVNPCMKRLLGGILTNTRGAVKYKAFKCQNKQSYEKQDRLGLSKFQEIIGLVK